MPSRIEEFAERVVRFDPPTHHYTLLVTADGDFRGMSPAGEATTQDFVDDRAIWDAIGDGSYRNVSADRTLTHPRGVTPVHGPEKLPSEYLAFFREHGWVCLTAILAPETIDGLQRVACTDAYAAERYDRERQAVSQHPAVARTVAEPVSLWLLRQYMRTPDVTIAHSPAMAVLTRDDGARRVQGWHSDYPYHWGVPARGLVPSGSGQSVLGVQRNVCVSQFSKEGGATAFKLGSHARDHGTPSDPTRN